MRPAYVWDCPQCDAENFARAIVPEMSPEDEAQLKEQEGIEAWEAGDWMLMPTEVSCSDCGASFATYHMRDSEDPE